eukprot:m.76752 g.76752  ORF g.76752 m.76752 type:complete len:448 (-) comp14658_c0_seq1:90-1433(-)
MSEYCLYRYKDTPAHGDDFSLSVVVTNMAMEGEQTLRTVLATRFSKSTMFSGSGNFSTISETDDPNNQPYCYYCLMRASDPNQESVSELDTSTDDALAAQRAGRATSTTSDAPDDYVFCFVMRTGTLTDLDLFRPELDAFCQRIMRQHERDLRINSTTTAAAALAQWHSNCVEYMARALRLCGPHLPTVLQLILKGIELVLERDEQATSFAERMQFPQQMHDMVWFQRAVSLIGLLDIPQAANIPLSCRQVRIRVTRADKPAPSTPAANAAAAAAAAQATSTTGAAAAAALAFVPTLVFAGEQPPKPMPFCVEWAEQLLENAASPAAMKQNIHNHQLQVIQEINMMKRLVALAESNHYALYNAYTFLQQCLSIPSLLLSSVSTAAQLDESSAQSREVLKALVDFVTAQSTRPPASMPADLRLRLTEAVTVFPSAAAGAGGVATAAAQ